MSRSPRRPGRTRGDDGFTLIEVMVAMGIFLVVTTAVAPLLVGSLRGAGVARDVTQTKGVAQARLEQMRNLPFYVGSAAGDFLDVLDTYYRGARPGAINPTNAALGGDEPITPASGCGGTTLSALPPESWAGYVSPTNTARCSWEPTTGAMYRYVKNPIVAPGLGVFSMVVSTQFLDQATPPAPVTPRTNYWAKSLTLDGPPSQQIGVTIAVFFKSQTGVHYTVTYTQIEQANPITPLLQIESHSSTLRVSSAQDADTNLIEQLGLVNLTGELFSGSRVVTTATGANAGSSLGDQINGASANLVAPVDVSTGTISATPQTFPSSGCTYQCFQDTKVDQATAVASNGLPKAGTATAPVRAYVPGGVGNGGFTFNNGKNGTRLQLTSDPMVSLDTSVTASILPISSCATTGSASGTAYLMGTGYLDSGALGSTACGTAQTNTVKLFPTSFAQKGVVQITLESATALCGYATSTGPTATAAYKGTLRYWTGPGNNDYSAPLALAGTSTTDPLAAVPLTQALGSTGLTLGDYISSWKSLVTTDLKRVQTGKIAEAGVPGAISIITQPTREEVGGTAAHNADPSSAISLTVGAVSCSLQDAR